MPEVQFTNPASPFLEMWAFWVSLTSIPDVHREPWEIRDQVIRHLPALSSESAGDKIRSEIFEIVADHLSSPDYRFFITEFEEKPGSWEIAFVVLGAFYGGVCGYGAFRQGLEYVYSDLKAMFGAIEGLKAKVRKRFKERHVMVQPRIEPTVDGNKTNIES
jgi:hypothetical protein